VAAHVGEVSGLTAIDVANVQQLVRLPLLHAVGFQFWRHPKVNGILRRKRPAVTEQLRARDGSRLEPAGEDLVEVRIGEPCGVKAQPVGECRQLVAKGTLPS
jgi:hypothetical protein